MKVRNVRPLAAQQRPQSLGAVESPDGLYADFDFAKDRAISDIVIVSPIFQNLVTSQAQQFLFAGIDFVFSARQSVTIVCQQHLHKKPSLRENLRDGRS